ncbi:hypothetical protein [Celeribacter neptunius]|uniref:Uncharacterized protein n=1 Tax=Celeribacter neptunius TaxID=588602 RepID=A0A1I3WJ99_9RHOB|nr:hypothetical protein [Celeribacter neptunius]SFK06937.1 hypothetical protein SAMN04487991_3754 [Celeribacter neptunius]
MSQGYRKGRGSGPVPKDDALEEVSEDALGDAFDRDLAHVFADETDEDVAELSRSVLSRIAREESGQGRDAHLAEVLSEPLPWALGFAGLMALGVALGYLASSGGTGDSIFAYLAFGDLLGLLGGF